MVSVISDRSASGQSPGQSPVVTPSDDHERDPFTLPPLEPSSSFILVVSILFRILDRGTI